MSTNSDRHKVQLYVETAIGCSDPTNLPSHTENFEGFSIGHSNLPDLQFCLSEDGDAYIEKSYRTYMQGLVGLNDERETWSLIKLYYSVYYAQRGVLCHRGIAFLRCKNIYTLNVAMGAKPIKRSGKNYQGDHKATARIFSDEYINSDILLSQQIDGQTPLAWMSGKREWVNYKRREFIDISGMDGFSSHNLNYAQQIKQALADDLPVIASTLIMPP